MIRKLRKSRFPEHGGQKKCAEALGIDPKQWRNWEGGHSAPGIKYQKVIATYFGVTLDELQGDEKAPGATTPRAEPPTYDAVLSACLSVQAAISEVVLHLNRERDLEPYRADLRDLADTTRSLQELLSNF